MILTLKRNRSCAEKRRGCCPGTDTPATARGRHQCEDRQECLPSARSLTAAQRVPYKGALALALLSVLPRTRRKS